MKKSIIALAATALISTPLMAANLSIQDDQSTGVKDTFYIGGGDIKGTYYAAAKDVVAGVAKLPKIRKAYPQIKSVEAVETGGTVENIEGFNAAESGDTEGFDVIIAQLDGENVVPLDGSYKSTPFLIEKGIWIFNKSHGLTDLEDVEHKSDEYSIIVSEGGGNEVMLKSFATTDSGYKDDAKNAIRVSSYDKAAKIAAQGVYKGRKIAGVLYTGRKVPSVFTKFKNKLAVGEITDGDFIKAKDMYGNRLYSNCTISKAERNGLSKGSSFDLDTYCVESHIFYRETGVRKFDKALERMLDRVASKYN